MFAAAAREVVFANPTVARRINEQFIPVALKAAMVDNPPPGPEGRLYAEIKRTRPAPQGICSMNSDGKPLAWALSFDNDASIPEFLDHVLARHRKSLRSKVVATERFMRFPSRKLPDVGDSGLAFEIPRSHTAYCPAEPQLQPGALVGSILGRALDKDAQPLTDTTRQEHYMEARLEVGRRPQLQLVKALEAAGEQAFDVPEEFAQAIVHSAFLGQLDVNPWGVGTGGRNLERQIRWRAQLVEVDKGRRRVRLEGDTLMEGEAADGGRGDGRQWHHRVRLSWYGFVDVQGDEVEGVLLTAAGQESLTWGSRQFQLIQEPAAAHLMAGHPIKLNGGVRYGLRLKRVRSD